MSSQASRLKPIGASQIAGPRPFRTAQEAWLASLSALLNEDLVPGVKDRFSIGSDFGGRTRNTRELSAVSFSIASPRERLIYSKQRAMDLGYAIANTIWVLIGSNDANVISFYNPRGRQFSDDGTQLFSAPGARIFESPQGDQFEMVIRKLKEDPTTRRAIITVFSSGDIFTDTRDYSCLVSLQFLLRRNTLSCIAYMRSQSALMVMPYDIFMLSMIHEAVALSINAEVGLYHHFCGSMHYYDDEENLALEVINESAPSPAAMPAMLNMSQEVRRALAAAEKHIRNQLAEDPLSPIILSSFGLDSYWTELLQVMIAAVRRRYGMQALEEIYRPPTPYAEILFAR